MITIPTAAIDQTNNTCYSWCTLPMVVVIATLILLVFVAVVTVKLWRTKQDSSSHKPIAVSEEGQLGTSRCVF